MISIIQKIIWIPAIRSGIEIMKSKCANHLRKLLETEPVVMNGPFDGLRYPRIQACGSSDIPKLFGTYEAELHPIFLKLLNIHFTTIVDIGCAEGYYAVGLARLFPDAVVMAYDIDPLAREYCANMVEKNNVTNVDIRALCDKSDLLALDVGFGTLILSDCEGYELSLFDEDVARHLRDAHLIIELHDIYNDTISPTLTNVFMKTHNVKFVHAISDWEKVWRYHLVKNNLRNPLMRKVAFSEQRPGPMSWLIAFPRNTEL